MNEIKTPPNNVEAEKAVLGAVLLDAVNKSGDKVIDICLSGGVNAETFYDPRNRTVYSTMLAMNRASKPLDAITLMDELRATEKFDSIGGTAYIQSLIDTVESTANAQYYIALIKAKHLRRRMIDAAKSVVDKCYDEKEFSDPHAILGDAESSFLEIGNRAENTMPWSAAVEDSFRRIDKMFSSKGKSFEGLSTGLTHLDEKLQGLKPSEMIVIAARPSVGKTSLAMNIAESVALGRDMNNCPVKTDGGKMHPVMIFSLEMPVEALSKRMVAGRAGIDMWKLNRGFCAPREKDALTNRLFQAVAELKAAPIIVDDAANLDIGDLRARARRAKKAHNIELIVIDYLQLCRCDDKSKQGRQLEVASISQQIKAMAKELKIPVIVLSQLSRANEQRNDKYEKPKLSDLRDSGAIEQDADVVFLLRRPSRNANDPEVNDQTLAIIDVAKNRNGETGEVRVNFIRELTRFCDREIPRSEESNFASTEVPPEPGEEFVQDPLC